MNILMIGDVVGEPGRKILARELPGLVERHRIDLVIANGENAAGGFGITPKIAEEFFRMGVHVITGGNHIWDKKEILDYIVSQPRLIRPANYPEGCPGAGSVVVETAAKEKVAVLHLMGRVFMVNSDCPFQVGKREVEYLQTRASTIIVDFHGEATSEKQAMGWYLDGKVAAVLGTHTHVQTADDRILPNGTAYLTDVGMTGPFHSVIGVRKDQVLEKFLTSMPSRFEMAGGPSILSAAVVQVDGQWGKAVSIERIQIRESEQTAS
jgi:metallophosphoesterase (TIGR00282 family)